MKSLFKWAALVLLPVIALMVLGAPAHAATTAHTSHFVSLLLIGAVLPVTSPTLLDLATRLDPNGQVANIVEIMNQYNEMLEDATFVEGNSTTGHVTTVRTGIPAPTWRKLYGGVQPSKSTTAKVTESFGMVANYSRIDRTLVELSNDPAAFRLSEDRPILEGIAQELSQTLIYGNAKTAPEEFTGLAARYNSLTAENGVDNIISGGGAGSDNTSIWLVGWGDQMCQGIVPKGSKAGIRQEDRGQMTVQNADGSMFEALVTYYEQFAGLSVRDWRYCVRIANIDVSDLTTLANTKNLVTWMTQATERIPSFNGGRFAFYCNRNIREKLRLGIIEKITTQLTWETVSGKRVMSFDGIPVRRVDQILNSEAVIS